MGDAGGARDAAMSRGDASHSGSTRDSGTTRLLPGSADTGATDSSACSHLNIGILGDPGTYTTADFAGWLESAGTSVTTLQTATSAVSPASTPLTAATLAGFDVVVLDHLTRSYTAAEMAVFAAWVAAGGGVAAMSGFTSAPDDFYPNTLLAPLGVQYTKPPPLLSGPVISFAPHPITQGMTSITFVGGWAIAECPTSEVCVAGACDSACSFDSTPAAAGAARAPIGFLPANNGSHGDSGSDLGTVPVAYAVTLQQGHAFVWGDEWIEYDTVWASDPQVAEFWIQVFAWIAPPHKCALDPPK